jgi:mycofactocin system glycosyltransferase
MSPLRLDPAARLVGDGVLIGGSPFRIVQLGADQAAALEARLQGRATPGDHHFIRWLLDRGFLHPEPTTSARSSDVDVVIPCHNHHSELSRLLDRLPCREFASVTVVDDGSEPAINHRPGVEAGPGVTAGAGVTAGPGVTAGAGVTAGPGVTVIRHHSRRGPAAARNTGWRHGRAPLVLFLDADVIIGEVSAWLDPLLALLPTEASTSTADNALPSGDPVAVAPRVVAEAGPRRDLVARYESIRPSADMGTEPATVRSGGRVPYLPAAGLVVRRSALESIDGFDQSMSRGEDVDLVWRLIAHGGFVYYQPAAVIGHPPRPTFGAWLRQRLGYGRGHGALAVRHPDAVTALELSPWTLAAWALVPTSARGVVAGAGLTAVSIPLLARRLPPSIPERQRLAARLAGGGTLGAGAVLAGAIRRSWLPAALAAAVPSTRWRRIVLAASAVPVLEWWRERPPLNPMSWWAMRLADDAAYCVGQWWGAAENGTGRALTIRRQELGDLLTPTAEVPPIVSAG